MYGQNYPMYRPPQASQGQSAQWMPRAGMGGTRIPVPQSSTPQGQMAIKSALLSSQAQGRFGNQLNQFADQGGVVAGQQSMPAGGELSQAQREQQMANYGPQNAALGGYMGG
jgi:hypothetical protein